MAELYGLSGEDKRRVGRSVRHTEHHIGRDRLRKRGKHGGGANKIYARIVQTLRRADAAADPPVTAIDYYEIELLDYGVQTWSATYGTYYVDDVRKYTSGSTTLIYKCIREHPSSTSKSPTNTTYWEEAENTKAWVFGYSGDLLETIPWFQPDDIVEVIKYEDSRWTDREWWIIETVVRVEDGSNCSVMWNDAKNRAMAVFG